MRVSISIKTQAEVLKALADETRLQLFIILMERGETCVCELAEMVAGTVSNLSFHLTKLKAAGLITDRKVGKWIFYQPNRGTVEKLGEWLTAALNVGRIPQAPAQGSMAEMCCQGEIPLSRSKVKLCCTRGRVMVTWREKRRGDET